MKPQGHRREMFERELVREASHVILFKLRDPRLGFVTITRAKVSSDYSQAKIFVSVMGEDKKKRLTMKAIDHAHGFIQHELYQRIRVKNFPELKFELDTSIEKTFEVTNKLERLAEERRARGVDPPIEDIEETTDHGPQATEE